MRRKEIKARTALQRANDRFFVRVWCRMALRGYCDAAGGAEYQRVLAEWQQAGQPSAVEDFIRRRAGWPVNGEGAPPKAD